MYPQPFINVTRLLYRVKPGYINHTIIGGYIDHTIIGGYIDHTIGCKNSPIGYIKVALIGKYSQ